MSDTIDALILDLLEWVGPHARPYAEVMEAWRRTSCPRLPVWEDANDRGFVERRREPGRGELVRGLGRRGGVPPPPPRRTGPLRDGPRRRWPARRRRA